MKSNGFITHQLYAKSSPIHIRSSSPSQAGCRSHFRSNTRIILNITRLIWNGLKLLCIIMKNGQIYFKNLAVWTPQDSKSMSGYFLLFSMKWSNQYHWKAYRFSDFWKNKHNALLKTDARNRERLIKRRFHFPFGLRPVFADILFECVWLFCGVGA